LSFGALLLCRLFCSFFLWFSLYPLALCLEPGRFAERYRLKLTAGILFFLYSFLLH